jgi:hypothetical protein
LEEKAVVIDFESNYCNEIKDFFCSQISEVKYQKAEQVFKIQAFAPEGATTNQARRR